MHTTTRHHTLTTIVAALLIATPLAACTNNQDPPTADETTTHAAPPTKNPADDTPQQRIEAYFKASDAAAANGWKDTSYSDEYLTPKVAKLNNKDDATNAKTGSRVTGDRKLTDWSVTKDEDTEAVVQFCDDTSDMKAEDKDGKPVKITNGTGESVAVYTLTREDTDQPWMISKTGYDKDATCDDISTQ